VIASTTAALLLCAVPALALSQLFTDPLAPLTANEAGLANSTPLTFDAPTFSLTQVQASQPAARTDPPSPAAAPADPTKTILVLRFHRVLCPQVVPSTPFQ
jgi:hypothetical protein